MKNKKLILTDIYYSFNNNGSSQLSDKDLQKLIKQQSILRWEYVGFNASILSYHFHKVGK